MDVLIRSLFPVSEILHSTRFLSCKCIFSFTTVLSVLCWQRSTKWKCREDSTFLTRFPVNTQWYHGGYWCNRKNWSRKALFHWSNPSLFGALPFAWVLLSMTRSAPTLITSSHQLCDANHHMPTWQTWLYLMITQAPRNSSVQASEVNSSMEMNTSQSLPQWLLPLNWSLFSLKSNPPWLCAILKFPALTHC